MICARDKGMQGFNSGSRNPNMRGSGAINDRTAWGMGLLLRE
jgi:hypothetical protein